ncbi:MAG: molybdenum ABC transporter ATP-binding protein [Rhodospirillales bacterium]|nr:molybdenum ABC transporter ATP-binding protein [Rhodospirillaceae bacterium]MDP6430547.1 molybdenum ABC transporter ATP-binding protein [Rhodospirillales bacterium]MDP6644012.1 molybdenum ABC transporter ATP-binding protein [Rhodospirillales bacterium]
MLRMDVRHQAGEFSLEAAFEAPAGSITAIFGQSGAGKTTLINLIAGLSSPAEGQIVCGGVTLFNSENGVNVPPERRRIGYVFQEGRLFPHMDVRRNLAYGYKEGSMLAFEQITELLDLGSLLARRPDTLSGGERQRVAIGRALLSNPALLLMDEPLASIDAQRRGEILPFIERLRDELSISIVYVSHAIDEVIRLADSMVLLSGGRVAAVGGVEELMSRLDLFPLTGRFEAGAVLAATCRGYDREYGLAELAFQGGILRVAGAELAVGTEVRVHIRARDVSLMLNRPEMTSVLNIFEGRVVEIAETGSPQVDVRLDIGSPLIARITRKSMHDLKLREGVKLHALVKAVAIDRRSLSATAASPRA